MKDLKEVLEALREKKITPAQAKDYMAQLQGEPSPSTLKAKDSVNLAKEENYGLVLSNVHAVHEILFQPWKIPAPDEKEVTIKVKASAINFPDVMCVKGLYPTMPEYPFVPGFEVAGVVVDVGSQVTEFNIGDEVIAVTGEMMGGHASHVNAPASSTVHKPHSLSFEEACSLPVGFTTVQYAFNVGMLSQGERVLIQTATGGCGLVAIQLARLTNCIIYGTSSKTNKLDFLQRIEVPYVLNYKSPFDELIREMTSGKGVDVVLNMLSGEGIQRGLNCLAPYGRYLEIAVHALKTSSKLDLSKLVHNQSFHSIDLRRKGLEKGFDGKSALQSMAALVQAGKLAPILSRVFPLHNIQEALAYVEKGEHIGKVVISHTATENVDYTEQCIERLLEQKRNCERGTSYVSQTQIEKTESAYDAIAVIGMSGQFPQAKNLAEYWDNLSHGRDCVSEVPTSRWPVDEYYHPDANAGGKSYSKWMGYLEDADKFDPLFFNISPAEAELMDPQQRVFLETCWHCIEDAGINPYSLSESKCGVFVGVSNSDYGNNISPEEWSGQVLMGEAVSILTARISYLLNLKGPSLAIDTACSSSLVAITEACNSLILKTSDVALAGGVYVMSGPSLHIKTSKASMLSSNGRCFTFDNRANGFVPGEAVGMLLLKRYKDAIRDNDPIYGVISGWGTNQDGKTNGITAPSTNSQIKLEEEVYRKFTINPETITMVEAHGTGTKLGDPIEVEALTESFRSFTSKTNYCSLGSAKSNIGHTLTAAGVAGVIKVLLAMKHKMIPPMANFETLNEHIKLHNSPFYINTKLKEWINPEGSARRACVSSFGFSGTNAHIVLEENLTPDHSAGKRLNNDPVIFVLSAKTEDQLNVYAKDMLSFLKKNQHTPLHDITYTLQNGREAMECRLAFTANSQKEIIDNLTAYIENKNHSAIHVSKLLDINSADTISSINLQDKSHDAIAALWTGGTTINWSSLYKSRFPRPVHLPVYPFARESYWKKKSTSLTSSSVSQNNHLHPLLHQNISDLSLQKFKTILSGKEFFVSDHVVNHQKILPGMAYIEMARAAFQYAEKSNKKYSITLKNIIWAKPVIVKEVPVELQIAVVPTHSGEVAFEIFSQPDGETGSQTIHSQGTAVLSVQTLAPTLNLVILKAQCKQATYSSKQCYDFFDKVGIEYGPAHKAIQEINTGESQVLAKLSLPEIIKDTLHHFVLHPALMDAALQSAVGLIMGEQQQPGLPFEVEQVDIFNACSEIMWAYVRYSDGYAPQNKIQKLDIDLCDNQGVVCARIIRLASRVINKNTLSPTTPLVKKATTHFFIPSWKEIEKSGYMKSTNYSKHIMVFIEPDKSCIKEIVTKFTDAECIILSSESKQLEERFNEYAKSVFNKLKEIVESKPKGKILIQVFTALQGENQSFAGLSGMLKTVSRENPSIITHSIYIEKWQKIAEELKKLFFSGFNAPSAEIHIGESSEYLKIWQPVNPLSGIGMPWKDHGVYIITGGSGALALLFAKEISTKVKQPIIILTGRSAPAPSLLAKIADIETNGASVEYKQANVSDKKQVVELIQEVLTAYGKINGIIHSAGVIRDNYLIKKTLHELQEVLAPKVNGLVYFDEACKDIEIDLFVTFSSLAGALGNPGQIDYACANAFMDAYAAYRNKLVASGHRYGQTLSINWPLWKEGAMQPNAETLDMMNEQLGITSIDNATGFNAFYLAFEMRADQVVVIQGDSKKIETLFTANEVENISANKNNSLPISTQQPNLDKTIQFLKTQLSTVLKVPVERLDANHLMEKYGIDSIMVIQLTSQLEKTFGTLPKTLFFEYQTIKELADYFRSAYPERLTDQLDTTQENKIYPVTPLLEQPIIFDNGLKSIISKSRTTNPRLSTAASTHSEAPLDIAIIGLAGRYPGAENIRAFWKNLKEGIDSITEIPGDRWNHDLYYDEDKGAPGKTYSKWGGFMQGVDHFDPLFFNISPADAEFMDPQERLFLECAYETLQDAGYTPKSLDKFDTGGLKRNVGVFVGVMYSEYQFYGIEEQITGTPVSLYGNPASIANRASFYFNLHGPSMAVDTMCSSSLTSIHLGCQSILRGECDLVLAGGVNVSVHPNKYLLLGQGKFASSKGKCESFGMGGDGYVPGEGVGAVLLKQASKAIADGDHIYGIIKATAVNHGGKTNGYTVPNPNAQSNVIVRALKQAGIDPTAISYIEAHGTGTSLGDPIEMAGLKKSFTEGTVNRQFCAIGSVKSNIGHLESAAGIAGVTKTLLQLINKQLVPSLHSETTNPDIDFANSPFFVQQKFEEWKRPVTAKENNNEAPLTAGVSSFGAGGSNAHVILQEYLPEDDKTENTAHENFIILLSAHTKEELKKQAERLRIAIDEWPLPDHKLSSMAYTLQTGREPMEERLAIITNSMQDLKNKLEDFIIGRLTPRMHYDHVQKDQSTLTHFSEDEDLQNSIEAWIQKKKHEKLLQLWVKGLDINWDKLYHKQPQRMSLPTYPFSKKRYWFKGTNEHAPILSKRNDGPMEKIEPSDLAGIIDELLHDVITLDTAIQRSKETLL